MKKIKKKKDYIWFIFPQPFFNIWSIFQLLVDIFYIDEEEIELFLKNTTLRKNLNSALHALEKKISIRLN